MKFTLFALFLYIASVATVQGQQCSNYKLFCERWMCEQNKRAGSSVYILAECKLDRPPSLERAGKLSVQATSRALEKVGVSKRTKAVELYDEGKANCATAAHPCICNPSIGRKRCERSIRFDVFFNEKSPFFKPNFLDLFAGRFIEYRSVESANLGVTDVDNARPDSVDACEKRYGAAACQAVSPSNKRRRLSRAMQLKESQR